MRYAIHRGDDGLEVGTVLNVTTHSVVMRPMFGPASVRRCVPLANCEIREGSRHDALAAAAIISGRYRD